MQRGSGSSVSVVRQFVSYDGNAGKRSDAGRVEATFSDDVVTLRLGPSLLEKRGPDGVTVTSQLTEVNVGVVVEERVVNVDGPLLTSDVQLDAIDAIIVFILREESCPDELRELTDGAECLHPVAVSRGTLSGLGIRNRTISVENVAGRRLLLRPSSELQHARA